MKRYKLVIPDKVDKCLWRMVVTYQKYDGKILEKETSDLIQDDCLQEWFKSENYSNTIRTKNGVSLEYKRELSRCWKAALENDKIKRGEL